MKFAMILYRLGALGLVLAIGVFWQEPLLGSLRRNVSNEMGVVILYGFPVIAGLILSFALSPAFGPSKMSRMIYSHGVALISVLWLLLWCFVWLAMMANLGDKAEMFIKHSAYLHLFGVGFSMAGYATGWMAPNLEARSVRFLMTVGWTVGYMAWFNLFLQPTLFFFWAPGVGGLLVVLGGFLMERAMKREVEAFSRVA